jgi:3,4-dihydroxy-9,10-secoandrosta-1,3,5(10)-triene-9,17-dione 4,5-dioxygenase
MDVRSLGYIGVDVADPTAWRSYTELLGAMAVASDPDGGFHIKIDDRPYRLVIQPSDAIDDIAFAGWELRDGAALDQAAAELEQAGYAVEQPTEALLRARGVRGLVRTTDPGGLATELFWGPIHDHELFVSPTGASGFVTGDMGLGHIVLGTPNLDDAIDFYTRVLGFRISDVMKNGDEDVVFLHCNARHHSVALVGAPELTLYHFMLEARTLDDVGYALDRFESDGVRISRSLGKHTNDYMVSFYGQTPSGFDLELGCGGRQVDDATWSVSEITKASFWGHRPPTPI